MEISSEAIEAVFKNIGLTANLITALFIVLLLNICAIGIRFYFDLRLKNQEHLVHRRNLLAVKAIECQEEIFLRLEKLSLFSKGEEGLLLNDLQELQLFILSKQIYLNKKMNKAIETVMDYYRKVVTDYRFKDIKTERKNLDEFIRIFNN